MIEAKAKLEEERDRLKAEGENVQSPFYLEKVARDELHLSKLGDTVVIVPENQQMGEAYDKKVETSQDKPNWMRWLDVLSGRIWLLESGQDGNASVLKTDVRKD